MFILDTLIQMQKYFGVWYPNQKAMGNIWEYIGLEKDGRRLKVTKSHLFLFPVPHMNLGSIS